MVASLKQLGVLLRVHGASPHLRPTPRCDQKALPVEFRKSLRPSRYSLSTHFESNLEVSNPLRRASCISSWLLWQRCTGYCNVMQDGMQQIATSNSKARLSNKQCVNTIMHWMLAHMHVSAPILQDATSMTWRDCCPFLFPYLPQPHKFGFTTPRLKNTSINYCDLLNLQKQQAYINSPKSL